MRIPEWPEFSDPDRRNEAIRRIAQRLGKADPLNRNELAVLFLLSHGVPRGLIAEWLYLGPAYVDEIVTHARSKLLATTAAHAVATALRLGLIS